MYKEGAIMAAVRTDAEFEAFYERHWKYVYRLCYTYMLSEADAEDCTEDIFVKNSMMRCMNENG